MSWLKVNLNFRRHVKTNFQGVITYLVFCQKSECKYIFIVPFEIFHSTNSLRNTSVAMSKLPNGFFMQPCLDNLKIFFGHFCGCNMATLLQSVHWFGHKWSSHGITSHELYFLNMVPGARGFASFIVALCIGIEFLWVTFFFLRRRTKKRRQ